MTYVSNHINNITGENNLTFVLEIVKRVVT